MTLRFMALELPISQALMEVPTLIRIINIKYQHWGQWHILISKVIKMNTTRFLSFAKAFPHNTVLLIDTYNTLESGLLSAIRIHKEYLEPNGYYLKGVRIDSGDLTYLSKKIREKLDLEGLTKNSNHCFKFVR